MFGDPKKWALPAAASLLAPWQDKLTQIDLISGYYQPDMSIAASVVGPLTAVATATFHRRRAEAVVRRRMALACVMFVLLLLTCFFLSNAVDVTWYPDETATLVLRFVWPALFLSVFAAFAFAAATAQMIAAKM